VVLTNGRDVSQLVPLFKALGNETTDPVAVAGWRLLPLVTLGSWIGQQLNGARTDKMRDFLEDVVSWTESL
jgi:hypothetical protein